MASGIFLKKLSLRFFFFAPVYLIQFPLFLTEVTLEHALTKKHTSVAQTVSVTAPCVRHCLSPKLTHHCTVSSGSLDPRCSPLCWPILPAGFYRRDTWYCLLPTCDHLTEDTTDHVAIFLLRSNAVSVGSTSLSKFTQNIIQVVQLHFKLCSKGQMKLRG